MAISVTPNLTTITTCDATTGWSPAPTLSTDFFVEGTGSVGVKVSAATSSLYKYTIASAIDCTGKHIYQWMLVTTKPDSKADGGYRMYVEDSSGNYGYWYVGGYDTAAGWTCFVIDPASTPTTASGTINVASIKYIGVQFKHTLKVTGTTPNCYWDISRYGTGLTVTSGTTDAITFENIYTTDVASSYGVVSKKEGVYIVNGKLIFGGTGSENVDFVDTNQLVVFPNNAFVSTSFYGIQVLAGSGTVNFTLGAKSGTAGISGCVLKSALSTRTFSFNVSDGDIDKMLLYGTTFQNAGVISLPATATNREVLNCNFNACGELVPSTCIMTNCNFVSAAAHAMQMSSTSHQVTASNFISCSRGVHIDTAGTYTFDALKFAGNTYDITNSTASAIIVNATNLANPSTTENTGGGSITINNAVTLTVQGVKTGSEPTNYVRCRIEKASDGTTIMNEEAQTSYGSSGYYKATESYNYTADVDVRIIARYKGYLPFQTTGTITSAGLTVTAVWIVDPNYT